MMIIGSGQRAAMEGVLDDERLRFSMERERSMRWAENLRAIWSLVKESLRRA